MLTLGGSVFVVRRASYWHCLAGVASSLARSVPEGCPKCDRSVPEVVPEVRPKCARSVPEVCLKSCPKSRPKSCPKCG